MRHFLFIFWGVLSVLWFSVLPVQAAGQAFIQTSQGGRVEQIRVLWLNTHSARMDIPRPPAEILLHNKTLYAISHLGGVSVVATVDNVQQLAQALGQGAGAFGQLDHQKARSVKTLKASGHYETIAGIRGEQYRVVWIDRLGKTHTDTAVLTHEPVVVDMTRSLQNMALSANEGDDARMIEFTRPNDGQTENKGACQSEWLGSDKHQCRGWGVLRYGNAFVLTSITSKAPAKDLLSLPTQSIDVQKILQGLSR